MTLEEKRDYLIAKAKEKRTQRELDMAKESEKSRQTMGKAVVDIQRQREEEMMKKAYDEKRKAEVARLKHRRDIQEKIRLDQERRKREREAEMEALRKAKEAQGKK